MSRPAGSHHVWRHAGRCSEARAAEAVEEALAARVAEWGDVPLAPSKKVIVAAIDEGRIVQPSALSAVKMMLFMSCKEVGVTRAELARRLGWHREQVDRLFRFDHASKIDQIEAAFGALGKRLGFELAA